MGPGPIGIRLKDGLQLALRIKQEQGDAVYHLVVSRVGVLAGHKLGNDTNTLFEGQVRSPRYMEWK